MTGRPTTSAAHAGVVSAYRFHMYEAASRLAAHGSLGRLYTALPRRLVREVRPELVRSHPHVAAPARALSKVVPRAQPLLNRAVIREFDRWAARSIEGHALVHALSSFATATLRTAASRGSRTICDRGSWHILEQKAVLEAEADGLGVAPPRFDPWLVARELEEYELVDRIFVPSSVAAASFERRGLGAKTSVLNFGADLGMFRPASTKDAGLVLYVGRIDLRKGVHRLVHSYRAARTATSRLRLVGGGDAEFIARLALRDDADITPVGPVSRPKVAEEMAVAGIFAIASVEEGLALVIPQAMASGAAVVCTDATGAGDIIRDGTDGIIVPARDDAAFEDALRSLLRDPDRVASIGESARRRMAGFGGWSAYGDRLVAEHHAVLHGR